MCLWIFRLRMKVEQGTVYQVFHRSLYSVIYFVINFYKRGQKFFPQVFLSFRCDTFTNSGLKFFLFFFFLCFFSLLPFHIWGKFRFPIPSPPPPFSFLLYGSLFFFIYFLILHFFLIHAARTIYLGYQTQPHSLLSVLKYLACPSSSLFPWRSFPFHSVQFQSTIARPLGQS